MAGETVRGSFTVEDASERATAASVIIHRNVLWSLGACVVPVPILDVIGMTAVQVKLMNELSALYKAPFREALARKLAYSLLSGLGGYAVGMAVLLSLGKVIPGAGHVLSLATQQLLTGAFTYATGRVYVMHLETGGTLLDFDPRAVRAHFHREFAEGKRISGEMRRTASKSSAAPVDALVIPAPTVRAPTVGAPTVGAPVDAATTAAPTNAAGISAAVTEAAAGAPLGSVQATIPAPNKPVVITAAAPKVSPSIEPLASPASPVVAGLVAGSGAPEVLVVPPLARPIAAAQETTRGLKVPAATGSVEIVKVHYKGTVKRTQADEYAELVNRGTAPIDVSGWTLDAGDRGQTFTFPQGTTLAVGQVIRVYTDEVHAETGGFKFGIRRSVWNDRGDRASLRDASGATVSVFAYGDKK